MAKLDIFVVYQDCYKCGSAKKWYEKQAKVAADAKIEITPLAYYQKGAAELIKKAAKKNVRVPFFTDGSKYSKSVASFIPKPATKKVKAENGKETTAE